ncbi:MAG: HAMP domain-containing histidine kinase [Leadbetterella sp.]|nr:HAMP domain-containing histidine kinase [Leadbetterella sp.]
MLEDIDEQLGRRLRYVTAQLNNDSTTNLRIFGLQNEGTMYAMDFRNSPNLKIFGLHSDIDIIPVTMEKEIPYNFSTVYKTGRDGRPVKVRYLTVGVKTEKNNYKVVLKQVYNEATKIIVDVTIGAVIICLSLLLVFVILTLVISKSLWKPFYLLIDTLKKFRIDQPSNEDFPESSIHEFKELSEALRSMTRYSRQQFIEQKQFAENASHEIQTPLTIALTGLDDLMQLDLGPRPVKKIQRIKDALHRMSNLSHGLLLLSKIDNKQFSTSEDVDISLLIQRLCSVFSELTEHIHVSINRKIQEEVYLRGHPYLYEVLFNNLIKNAVQHSSKGNAIEVLLSDTTFRISNIGDPIPFDETKIFDRFVKNSKRPGSIGLGLSLVKQIASLYKMEISYLYEKNSRKHTFQVTF